MDNRKHLMERCIDAYKKSKHSDCDIFCYWQGSHFDDVCGKDIFKGVVIDSKPRGVFTPRYELMKRFSKDYDYTVIIDDDLFMTDETDYLKPIKFLKSINNTGVVCISNTKIKNLIETYSGMNVDGGLVIPQSGVLEILRYFSDKEKDYTFDYFWLLLYVKGYDLFKDWRTRSNHVPSRKVNGEFSGFNWHRYNTEYVPMLEEFYSPAMFKNSHGGYGPQFIHISDLNENGKRERNRCYNELRGKL